MLHHPLLEDLLQLDLDLLRQLVLLSDRLTILIKLLVLSKFSRDLGIGLSSVLKKLNYLFSGEVISNVAYLSTLHRQDIALLVSHLLLLLHLLHEHLLLLLLHLVIIHIVWRLLPSFFLLDITIDVIVLIF